MQIVANYIHVLVLQTCFFKTLIVAWKTRKLVVKNISYPKINRVTQSKIRYRTLVKINIFAIFKKVLSDLDVVPYLDFATLL